VAVIFNSFCWFTQRPADAGLRRALSLNASVLQESTQPTRADKIRGPIYQSSMMPNGRGFC
jgi:hypothetical protein